MLENRSRNDRQLCALVRFQLAEALYETPTALGCHVYHHIDLLFYPAKLERDHKLWGEALRAGFRNQGEPYGRVEFDKMLADYDVNSLMFFCT